MGRDPDRPAAPLRLTLVQTDPRLLDPEGNVAAMARWAGEGPASDLVVFPELSLSGYRVEGKAAEVALELSPEIPSPAVPDILAPLASLPSPVLVGLPEVRPGGGVHNSALLLAGGEIGHRVRKCYLPGYGIFQEDRWFTPSSEAPAPVDLDSGWRVGILICEDFWHPSLVWLLAMGGIHLLVVQSAAPGRPSLDPNRGRFPSSDRWELLARFTATHYGVYVALVNRAGREGSLTYAGNSMLWGPEGDLLWMAPALEEARQTMALDPEALQRARTPFSHLREEDPSLLLRGMARNLALPGAGGLD